MITLYAIAVTIAGFILAFRGLKHPGLLLGLLWSIYAFEQVAQISVPIFAQRPWLINVSITGLTAVAVLRCFFEGRFSNYRITGAHLLAGLLLILCFISYLWSISPSDTVFFLKRNLPYIFAFAVLAPLCGHDVKQIELATSTVLYFGLFILIGLAIGPYSLRGLEIQIAGRYVEANPLAAASFGGYASICSIYYLYKTKSKDFWFNAIHVAICILGLYVIVRSGSRGQLIAVVLATAIWLPITAQFAVRKSILTSIILIAAIGFGAIYLVGKVNSTRWRDDLMGDATSGRIEQTAYLIEQSFESGSLHIFFGLGNSASYQVIGGYPHNVPGEVLAEEGFVGLLLFVGFLVYVTFSGIRWMTNRNLRSSIGVTIGMLLTLFTFDFGLCLKQGSLLSSSRLFCLGFCILATINSARTDLRKKNRNSPRGFIMRDVPVENFDP